MPRGRIKMRLRCLLSIKPMDTDSVRKGLGRDDQFRRLGRKGGHPHVTEVISFSGYHDRLGVWTILQSASTGKCAVSSEIEVERRPLQTAICLMCEKEHRDRLMNRSCAVDSNKH